MRLPYSFEDPNLEDNARVKFTFTSPELNQNIEISLDGNETTVEALLDAFQRFLGALGISTPDNVILGFVEVTDEPTEEDDQKENN